MSQRKVTGNRLRGVDLTLTVLGSSVSPGVGETLCEALTETDPVVQTGAVETILKRRQREELIRVVESFHLLNPTACQRIVDKTDELLPVMRDLVGSSRVQTRANVVEIVVRGGRVKLAYLLVKALDDESSVSGRALSGLRQMVERYGEWLEAARSGAGGPGRSELEGKKYALVEPLLGALTTTRALSDELLELTMGLDTRLDDALWRIMVAETDPRAVTVRRMVETSSQPGVVSFLLGQLRDERRREQVAGLLERRGDAEFVRRLLEAESLWCQPGVRAGLSRVGSLDWLERYAVESVQGVTEVSLRTTMSDTKRFVRALGLVALSGMTRERKESALTALSAGAGGEFQREAAGGTREAIIEGRSGEAIWQALEASVREAGARPAKTRAGEETSSRELGWARRDAGRIPRDAFREFFQRFDTLTPEVRSLAAATLTRLDPRLDTQLRETLTGLDPETRVRAVRMVESLGRQEQVEATLLQLVQDPEARVRATVVKVLSILGSERAVRALLKAVTDFDRRVVANTVEGLEATGFLELVELMRIFTGHPNNRIRANAVKALMGMGVVEAEPVLREMLICPEEMMRLSGTWVLGEIDHPQRLEWLRERASQDDSARVRQKARNILDRKVTSDGHTPERRP